MTGPTLLQQKTVEGLSHFGRVEAVNFRPKSVEGFVLNRNIKKVGLTHVAGQVIHSIISKHMRWQMLPRLRGKFLTHMAVKTTSFLLSLI